VSLIGAKLAFSLEPQDVRSWPVLDPLAPHALMVARRGDEAGIAQPTSRVLNDVGVLSSEKARYAEAEPLYRRALAIGEAALRPDDPELAILLNNLASFLQKTNRLGEAEPLCRRALEISEKTLGPDHPVVATRLNNLAELLRAANRPSEPALCSAVTFPRRSAARSGDFSEPRLLVDAPHRLRLRA
jgi:tetratricopeptide (TPR) repeat protein